MKDKEINEIAIGRQEKLNKINKTKLTAQTHPEIQLIIKSTKKLAKFWVYDLKTEQKVSKIFTTWNEAHDYRAKLREQMIKQQWMRK